MSLSDNEIICILKDTFYNMALKDMKKCIKNNLGLTSFIIGACILDSLAGFFSGRINDKNGKIGSDFIDFIKEYLFPINSRYNGKDFWKGYRCALLHAYSGENNFFFREDFIEKHLKKADLTFIKSNISPKKDAILLNVKVFYKDLYRAVKRFFADLSSKSQLKSNVRNRFSTHRPIIPNTGYSVSWNE